MARWKLTIRNGSDVSRLRFDDLDAAVAEGLRVTKQILDEDPMSRVQSLRDFEPEDQIKARIEMSGKGILKPPTAGVDIHGDLHLQAFEGGVVRNPLPGDTGKEVFESIRQSLG